MLCTGHGLILSYSVCSILLGLLLIFYLRNNTSKGKLLNVSNTFSATIHVLLCSSVLLPCYTTRIHVCLLVTIFRTVLKRRQCNSRHLHTCKHSQSLVSIYMHRRHGIARVTLQQSCQDYSPFLLPRIERTRVYAGERLLGNPVVIAYDKMCRKNTLNMLIHILWWRTQWESSRWKWSNAAILGGFHKATGTCTGCDG